MKRFVFLFLPLIAFLAVVGSASAQSHTFCAEDSNCSITGVWTFSAGGSIAATTAGSIATLGSNGTFWGVQGGVQGWYTGSGGGGTPGGSTTQFQYNNAGAFGGIADLTFNGTHTITLGASGILALTPGASVTGITNTMLPVVAVGNGGTSFSSYVKGQLLCPSASTTLTQLAVGTDTQVLTADSTQTCGIKWATPVAGTTNAATQYSGTYYSAAGSATTLSGYAAPTTNGFWEPGYNVTAGVAVAPQAYLGGMAGTAGLTGATSTYTILYSDNEQIVPHDYAGSSSIAITLPTPTTLGNANFVTSYCNYAGHTDTITPTTWTINGNASQTVAQNVCYRISVDPNNSGLSKTNWLAIGYGTNSSGNTTSTSLTTSHLPKSNGANSIIDSTLVDNGTTVTTTEPLLVSAIVDGLAPITNTTGTSATLGAGTYNSGYTFNQEATAGTGVTYTLPATVKGAQYCVANNIVSGTGAPDTGILTVYPPASSYVILKGVINTIGGGGTHGVVSGGAAADAACFVANDSTHWTVYVQSGTWTAN